MRWLGYILAGCVALAVLRAILWAGAVLWGLLLLYALIRHPKELMGFLMLLATLTIANQQPALTLLTIAGICLVGQFAKHLSQ